MCPPILIPSPLSDAVQPGRPEPHPDASPGAASSQRSDAPPPDASPGARSDSSLEAALKRVSQRVSAKLGGGKKGATTTELGAIVPDGGAVPAAGTSLGGPSLSGGGGLGPQPNENSKMISGIQEQSFSKAIYEDSEWAPPAPPGAAVALAGGAHGRADDALGALISRQDHLDEEIRQQLDAARQHSTRNANSLPSNSMNGAGPRYGLDISRGAISDQSINSIDLRSRRRASTGWTPFVIMPKMHFSPAPKLFHM